MGSTLKFFCLPEEVPQCGSISLRQAHSVAVALPISGLLCFP